MPCRYALPGYWTKHAAHGERYSYYRKSTCGSNTLTFDADVLDLHPGWTAQVPEAISNVSAVGGDNGNSRINMSSFAVVDMTSAYRSGGGPSPEKAPAARVMRGAAFTPDFATAVIVDEFDYSSASNVTWAMHTSATIVIGTGGRTAVLKQQNGTTNVTLHATLLKPLSASFSVRDVALAPPQKPAHNLRKLMVRLELKKDVGSSKGQGIAVALTHPDVVNIPELNGLDSWAIKGPFVGR